MNPNAALVKNRVLGRITTKIFYPEELENGF